MKPGRNDPCPCGSGKKYKQCCLLREANQAANMNRINLAIPNTMQQALLLHQAGRLSEAELIYQQVLRIEPNHSDALHLLGLVAHQAGKSEMAVDLINKAIGINPADPLYYLNLGAAYEAQSKLLEAAASFRKAILIQPNLLNAHLNLGNALRALGQFEEAANSFRQAIGIKPDYVVAHSNLAITLQEMGRIDEAVTIYRCALALKPDHITYYNLGNALKDIGQFADAVTSYSEALKLKADFAVYYNLGNALKDLGQPDGALANLRKALEINPNNTDALVNLGYVCSNTGLLDEALYYYRRVIELDPADAQAHSDLIFALGFHPGYDWRSILAEVKEFSSVHQTQQLSTANTRAWLDKDSDRRLRIGYVSPDFRNHCQSLFTKPLLSNHDHEQFEIYCYADLARPDAISEQLSTYADVWRLTNGKTDQQVAEMIARDGIDILVDLTMHMANARPLLFALKPAPVQVAWLAYPGTTGIPAIDYRFTDPWLDPPELGDDRYTEKSIRLADTFWCYDPLTEDVQPNRLPAIEAGYVTFGCLNNFCKVSDATLNRWGQVMARVPMSRLILLSAVGQHRQRVFDLLEQHGIAAERIEFVAFQPRAQYLQTYHRIDICLDTLPYNGHTTSLDAYWMGVPVVTEVGHTVVGRAGLSQLHNLGLSELVAVDEQGFIGIAVDLASDFPRLCLLRETLRGRMQASPLMDGKRFARAIEAAYKLIWKSWCER